MTGKYEHVRQNIGLIRERWQSKKASLYKLAKEYNISRSYLHALIDPKAVQQARRRWASQPRNKYRIKLRQSGYNEEERRIMLAEWDKSGRQL